MEEMEPQSQYRSVTARLLHLSCHTSDPERGGPGRTPIRTADSADVQEVGAAVQPLQTAVDRVQPVFVRQHARDRPQLLKRARFGCPGDTRSWEDVAYRALHLLVAAEPRQV